MNDTLDMGVKREGSDLISYFKKKCLKSKILSEDIDSLKRFEEKDKTTELIKRKYHVERDSRNRSNNALELNISDFETIDIFSDKELNMDLLGKFFMKNSPRNNLLNYSVLIDEFSEFNTIVLEIPKEMTILIKVDQTHMVPICCCF